MTFGKHDGASPNQVESEVRTGKSHRLAERQMKLILTYALIWLLRQVFFNFALGMNNKSVNLS